MSGVDGSTGVSQSAPAGNAAAVVVNLPPLEGRFEQMVIGSGVPANFVEFLRKAGIVQADSFAVWCAEENLIQKEIIDAAKAEGFEVKNIVDKCMSHRLC